MFFWNDTYNYWLFTDNYVCTSEAKKIKALAALIES